MLEEIVVEIIAGIFATVFLGVFYILWRLIGWRAIIWPKQAVRGWLSEDAGRELNRNPYPKDSPEWKAWRDGWNASRDTNP